MTEQVVPTALDEMLKTELAAIRQAVVDHKDDKATLDTDKLAAKIVELQDAAVAARVAAAEAARPVLKGAPIGAVGFEAASLGMAKGGKFHGRSLDDVVFAHQLMTRVHTLMPQVPGPSDYLGGLVKQALTATGTLTGDELVPTGMAAQLWEDAFLASRVVSIFGPPIPMPTDPFDIPFGFGAITWRKGTAVTGPTAVEPATGKATLTATEQIAEVDVDYMLTEDAVVAVLPTLRAELARSAGEQMDAFMLNACSTDAANGNINLDDADPAADSYYLTLGQNGIRHLYLVDKATQSADVSAALTDALMMTFMARAGKYAVGGRSAFITNARTYIAMMGLTNVVTADKFGALAPILTGYLAAYMGVPIVVSESMPMAEDDGKVSTTAGNNDEGQIALVHRDSWKVGFRRELMIEVDRDIQKRMFILVASFREAVAARGVRSTATHTAGIHGITF